MRTIQEKLNQFLPFIYIGTLVTLCAIAVILFSYLLIWGTIIGGLFYCLIRLKQFFVPQRPQNKPHGIIIEYDTYHKPNEK